MKEAVKEVFENNMHHYETMKTIAKAYLSNCECSRQETFYLVLPKLKLRKLFLVVHFVNTSLPEERVQVLLSEEELSEPPGDSSNNFKRSNTDRYMENQVQQTFCNSKYRVLKVFCYAEFLAYYTIENK